MLLDPSEWREGRRRLRDSQSGLISEIPRVQTRVLFFSYVLLISVFWVHAFMLYRRKTGKPPARDMERESESRENVQLWIQMCVLKKVASLPCWLSFKHLERFWWSMSTHNSSSAPWVLKRLHTAGVVWRQCPGLRPPQGNCCCQVSWSDHSSFNTSLWGQKQTDRCMRAFTLEWIVNKWKTVDRQKIHSTSYFACGSKKSCFWWGLGFISFPCKIRMQLVESLIFSFLKEIRFCSVLCTCWYLTFLPELMSKSLPFLKYDNWMANLKRNEDVKRVISLERERSDH